MPYMNVHEVREMHKKTPIKIKLTVQKKNGTAKRDNWPWKPCPELTFESRVYDWEKDKKKELRKFVARVRDTGYTSGEYWIQAHGLQFYTIFKGKIRL